MREILEHVVHGALALWALIGAIRRDVRGLTTRVRVRVLAALGTAGIEEPRSPAAEEGAESGHRTGHDGEVAFDGGPDIGDIVVSRLGAKEQELVHVDETNDSNDGDTDDNDQYRYDLRRAKI